MTAILDQVNHLQFARRELELIREPPFLAALRETESAAERLASHSTFLRLLGDTNDFASRIRASRPILDLVQASSAAPAPSQEEEKPDEPVGEHVGPVVTSYDQALYLKSEGLL